MLRPASSVNHIASSGPRVMSQGKARSVGIWNSFSVLNGSDEPVLILPMTLPISSVNQMLPFSSAAIPVGNVPGVSGYSAINPSTVMRPIWSTFSSVNPPLPSPPRAISHGWAFGALMRLPRARPRSLR